jgi:hypothetical protein
MRAARFRALMMANEIEMIGVALSRNVIDVEAAQSWMDETYTLEFLMPSEPPFERGNNNASG